MQIVRVEASTLVIPMERGVAFSTRTLAERHYTLVRVHTDDGIEGLGFAYMGHSGGHLGTLAVRELLRPLVLGQDPHQAEGLWDALYRETLLHGRRGLVLRAMSALDIALWDCVAKAAGLPLYQYLGACRQGSVPCYYSGGYYAEGKTPEHLAEECRSWVEKGFKAVKIKVGRLPPEEDALRIAAVRKAIGPRVALYLDVNNAFSDVPTAVRAARLWEEYGPGWIEEPFLPDDVDGHAALSAQTRVPVATGEIGATRWDFAPYIHRRAVSILQHDAAVCGGITEWRRISAMAAGVGITIAPHWFADLHVHLVASTPNATIVEYFPPETGILNFPRALHTRLQVRDGELVLPDRPGLGIELDPAAVQRFSVDGWG